MTKKKMSARMSEVGKHPRFRQQGKELTDILRLRIALGLTQEQTAEALGLKRRVLAGYERGDFPVKAAYTRLLKAMVRFEIHPSELELEG